MIKKEYKAGKDHAVFQDYFRVDSTVVEELHDGNFFSDYYRYKLVRKDAVAVLVYNVDSKKVILVRQFRYPVAHKTNGSTILEIPAGKIDEGETPEQAAIREVEEEIGYRITEDMLTKSQEIWPSPGYSTESIFVYAVLVNDHHKVSSGGGVEGEHESIDIVEMDLIEFRDKISSNFFKDSKTIIGSNLISTLK